MGLLAVEFNDNFVGRSWKDDLLFLTLAFFVGTALLWVFNVIPAYAHVSNVFLIMLIVAGFIHLPNLLAEASGLKLPEPLNAFVYGAGDNAGIKFALGFALGALLVFTKAIILPIPQAATEIQIAGGGVASFPILGVTITAVLLAFFFQVIAAPFVEEYFFRTLVFPILNYLLGFYAGLPEFVAGMLALVGQALIFVAFHLLVYGSSAPALTSILVFGILAGLITVLAQSFAPAMGLHFANNLLLFLKV